MKGQQVNDVSDLIEWLSMFEDDHNVEEGWYAEDASFDYSYGSINGVHREVDTIYDSGRLSFELPVYQLKLSPHMTKGELRSLMREIQAEIAKIKIQNTSWFKLRYISSFCVEDNYGSSIDSDPCRVLVVRIDIEPKLYN